MISWINIAKGLGIIFIVYGHSYPPEVIYHFFYYFHIPLFFFISGYLFNKPQPSFIKITIHKFKTLMIPFYVYGFFMTLLIYLLYYLKGSLSEEIAIHYLMGLINGKGSNLANSDLWFLPSLFFTNLFAYIALKKLDFRRYILFELAIIFVFTSLTDRVGNSVYSITTVPPALFFFIMGYLYKEREFEINSFKYLTLYGGVVLAIFSFSYFFLHHTVDIGGNYYGKSIILLFLNGLLGTLLIIFISKKIKSNSFLEYIGTISLYIFIFHQIFVPITDIINNLFEIEKYFLIIGTVKLIGSIILYQIFVKPVKKRFRYL